MAVITVTLPDATNADLIAAVCANDNYQAIIPNPLNGGAPMQNPLSQGEFAISRLVAWGVDHIHRWQAAQAQAAGDAAVASARAAQTPPDPSQVQVQVTAS